MNKQMLLNDSIVEIMFQGLPDRYDEPWKVEGVKVLKFVARHGNWPRRFSVDEFIEVMRIADGLIMSEAVPLNARGDLGCQSLRVVDQLFTFDYQESNDEIFQSRHRFLVGGFLRSEFVARYLSGQVFDALFYHQFKAADAAGINIWKPGEFVLQDLDKEPALFSELATRHGESDLKNYYRPTSDGSFTSETLPANLRQALGESQARLWGYMADDTKPPTPIS
ncbi:MAG TPA: hypothetical protein PLO78_06425 [Candidatus Omnitrophota bacterium]|nr:hypothetical protein [Candidatus Omnitrophota bacterium]